MRKLFDRFYFQRAEQARAWGQEKVFNLFIFNIILALLLLLHSAGYFAPFFTITINLIVLFSLVLFVILLGIKNKIIFSIALFFWLFAALMRVLGVDVWAERTVIYSYEALMVGIVMLIFKNE